MSKAVQIGRFVGKLIGILLAFILLLILLINLPFVQDRITGFAEDYVNKKTNAGISIEKISVNFLGHILIKELLVPDQQKDTLLHLGKLEVGIQLRGLLRKKIRIKSVELDDVLVDIHPAHDTVMNYQYLIDAFSGPPKEGEEPEAEEVTKEDDGGTPWDIILPKSRLALNDVEFDYLLPDSAMVMNYRIGKFEGRTDRVDLLAGAIGLDRLALEDSDIYIKIGTDTTETVDTAASALNYRINAGELAISRVRYRMDLDDLRIDSYVGSAVAAENHVLLLGDTMRINIAQFDLEGSKYRMDTPSAPPSPGLDYSHLDLEDIQIRISDFDYDDLDISGEVRQIAGRDKCGFELSDFKTRIHYTLDSIELWQLHTSTPQTRINAEHAKVTFPFLEDSTLFEQMLIDLQLDSTVLHPVDIAYFVPQLDEQDFFRQHRERPLNLNARIYGTLADLEIGRFELRGWDAYAGLSGRLQHVTDMDNLVLALRINAIESTGPGIKKWLPPDALPEYMELPDEVTLRGQVNGPLRRLDLRLEATTSRTAQPLAARLQLEGELGNVMDPDRLFYDMTIDTIWVSRMEMNAYLPDSFPAYIELPEAVSLAGKLKGTMDTVFADLHLEAFRDSLVSEIRIAGTVDSFTNTEALAYDLKLNELIVQPEEIAAYLPDSTLPAYLRVPLIEHGEGAFLGDLANINAQFEIDLSDGTITADAKLRDSAYVANLGLEDFNLQGLFQDSTAYDTVVGWPAPPIALQVTADGRGLDIDRDLKANAAVRLRFLGDTINWEEGLVLKGKIDRKSFEGNLTVQEREVDLDLSLLADFNPGMDTSVVEGSLNKLDLFALKVMDKPFDASAGLTLTARGRSPDSLYASLLASDFNIMFNNVRESTSIMVLTLEREKAKDYIGAVIFSDFLNAYVVDQANNPNLVNDGLPKLADRIGIPVERLELNPDSTKNLFATLEVIRPGIFTSGIVPGLTELEPVEALGALDLQDTSFAVYTIVPHVKYLDYQVDSLEIAAVNWDNFFVAAVGINHAKLFDRVEVEDLSLSGFQLMNRTDTINLFLSQTDTILAPNPTEIPLRFNVGATVSRNKGVYTTRFYEKPVLNFDTLWRFDPNNEIVFGNGQLHIRDLRLSREDRSLTVNEVSQDQINIDFDNFDFRFFSDIVKWNSDYAMGVADGQVVLRDIMTSPQINADLKVADFGVMASRLGNLDLSAANDTTGAWKVEAGLNGEGNDVALTGSYTPTADSALIDGRIVAQPLNLSTLDSLAKDFVKELGGGLITDLAFSGSLNHPVIEGTLDFDEVVVRPNITGSRLEIPTGRVEFSEGGLVIEDPIAIRDSLGNEAKLVLLLATEDYREMYFAGGLNADNFLLLNTTEKDNDLYYGRIFSAIDLRIAGNIKEIVDIDCKLTPGKGSSFVYLFDQGDDLKAINTGDGLVEFVDFDFLDKEKEKKPVGAERDTLRRASGFDINISADLNNDLDLTVVMDRQAGDRLEGKAEGNVVLNYPSSGEMELTGQIDVSGSKYFYTYQQVIKKEFELQDGSSVIFTGPVDNADINLKAGYVAKTAPYTLVSVYGDVDQNSSADVLDRARRRQEFLVTIRAEGTLEKAELTADIEYPRVIGNNSTDLVEPALEQLRDDRSEMNTQAFSLILFNSFRLSEGATAGKSFINLKQELGDLLASQLNNLANKYINFVELNFDIETLAGDEMNLNAENVDFRLGVKKRFLDDRLVIEVDGLASTGRLKRDEYGNLYTEQNMQAFLENVSVEYSLNEKGSLRVRVFNEYDYDDFIGSNIIRLGGTLILSKDFNRLIFKKNPVKRKSGPEPLPAPVDSTGNNAVEPRDTSGRRR